MGIVSSCCEKDDYTEIKDGETAPSTAATPSGKSDEGMEFTSVQKDETHFGTEKHDQNSSTFAGIEMDLKFTSKSSYEKKFVWLNSFSHTIHMSLTPVKEKRHKEASLADVTDVISGPPNKCKELTPAHEALCLTVNFKRRGGIDLKFDTETERDLWFKTLNILTKEVAKLGN